MNSPSEMDIKHTTSGSQLIRGAVGGLLMGLANLVPGISGGTMLLAAGVYPQFIEGITEISRFRFRTQATMVLAAIALAAVLVIVTLAGAVKNLIVDHRWIMYSLFIGLTLGGVPIVWSHLRKITTSTVVACVLGIAIMATMAVLQPGEVFGRPDGIGAYLILFVAGITATSAMILPGVSGSYLLLILGQYLPILDAIDQTKEALLQTGGPHWVKLLNLLHVFIPLSFGVLVGAIGVSSLVRFFLTRYEKATLGFLMGLLLGAVLGLWPFQRTVLPDPGVVMHGQVMTAKMLAALDPTHYPMESFSPGGEQFALAAGLVLLGWLVTYCVAFVGKQR